MYTPIKLVPVTKSIIWGGTRLSRDFGIGKSGEKIAEAWELTCRNDGDNVIIGGAYDGMKLSEFIEKYPDTVSDTYKSGERFPLLIKLIDAERDLSIQVHPDDGYAHEHTDDDGKTEFWYIADADENAKIIYGLNGSYTTEQISDALKENSVEGLMNYVNVKKGDCFFIPSGKVHAICAGCFIAEIQQNSNITYRVYDYNRPGADGKPRPLHIKDALAVIERFKDKSGASDEPGVIADCEYFKVRKYEGTKGSFRVGAHSFVHLLASGGEGSFTHDGIIYLIKGGESYFLPADSGEIKYDFGSACVIASEIK